jgi:hypothetical protein
MATATRLDMAAERLDGVGGPIGSTGPGTAGQVLYWQDAVSATSEAALAYNASTNKLTVSGGVIDSALTPGRVVVSTTAGELADQAGLTASGGALTAANLTSSGLTATRVTFAGTAGLLEDDAGLLYAKATDGLTVLRGSVDAGVLKTTGIATPGSITVTPTLTQTASITTLAWAALVDGETFTIDDGTTAGVFEFDSNAAITPGNVAVTVAGTEDADAIRDLIVIAVNTSGLDCTAVANGAATVLLTHSTPGAAGGANSDTVTDAGFAVSAWADPTAATTWTYVLVARLADGTTALIFGCPPLAPQPGGLVDDHTTPNHGAAPAWRGRFGPAHRR